LPETEVAPKARIQLARRTIGSRTLPKELLVIAPMSRASASSRIARTTAARSPRTPAPLLLKTAATLCT